MAGNPKKNNIVMFEKLIRFHYMTDLKISLLASRSKPSYFPGFSDLEIGFEIKIYLSLRLPGLKHTAIALMIMRFSFFSYIKFLTWP